MLRHRLKTGDTAKRSLHKALRTRALSETLKERNREYTSLRCDISFKYCSHQTDNVLSLNLCI